MRFSSLILFLAFILAPVWISVGEAVQTPFQQQPPPETQLPSPDKSDPLFQEFIKEVEKSGPILRDPARPPRPAGTPHEWIPSPNHGPMPQGQTEEMRWQSVEQLLRNAREIRTQAELVRSLGQKEPADRLLQLADELRRTAIQIAPTPQSLKSPQTE